MAECSARVVSNNLNSNGENKSGELEEPKIEERLTTVMEHLLLEEYDENLNLPTSLKNLFDYFQQESIAVEAADIIAAFIYIFMLETGFVTTDYVAAEGENTCDFHYKRILKLTHSMPREWKRNGVYKFSFVLPTMPRHLCMVTCITIGEDVVVNCSIKHIVEGNCSLLIDPMQYIVNRCRFQNLKGLSIKFKNTVSIPLKNTILERNSLRSISFKGLPPELICKVVKYCDKESVSNLEKAKFL